MVERQSVDVNGAMRLLRALHADLIRPDGGCGREAAWRRLVDTVGWRFARWQICCQDEVLWESCGPRGNGAREDSAPQHERAGTRLGHRHRWWWAGGNGDEVELQHWVPLLDALAGADELAERMASALGAAGAPEQGDAEAGFATVTASGVVIACDGRFTGLVEKEFGAWDGRRLPFALDPSEDCSQHGRVVGRLWIRIRAQGQYLHLSLRPDRRAATISPREYDIAARIADGKTFREVAADLELAPSTVSTHVYNLYAKLGLQKRSELVQWFGSQSVDK